jgi:hypothetical protein
MNFYYNHSICIIFLIVWNFISVAGVSFRNRLPRTLEHSELHAFHQSRVLRRLQGQPSPQTFGYTGSIQTLEVPADVQYITVDITGAAGGVDAVGGGAPGFGARVQTTIPVVGGSVLNIFVGGRGQGFYPCGGTSFQGGWNGGGFSYPCGTSGGGASDIRVGGTDLINRIIVAGGGGGWNVNCHNLGGSGGEIGSPGTTGCGGPPGLGGTASMGGNSGGADSQSGSVGVGGATSNTGAGGGGGYYGGKKLFSQFHFSIDC